MVPPDYCNQFTLNNRKVRVREENITRMRPRMKSLISTSRNHKMKKYLYKFNSIKSNFHSYSFEIGIGIERWEQKRFKPSNTTAHLFQDKLYYHLGRRGCRGGIGMKEEIGN